MKIELYDVEEEYGVQSTWKRLFGPNSSAPLKPLTVKGYCHMVHALYLGDYGSGCPCPLDFRLIAGFFNKVKPTTLAKHADSVVRSWLALAGRPHNMGRFGIFYSVSSYNPKIGDFADLCIRFGFDLTFINKVSDSLYTDFAFRKEWIDTEHSNHNSCILYDIAAKFARRGYKKLAVRAMRAASNPLLKKNDYIISNLYRVKFSDLKRIFSAPSEVRQVVFSSFSQDCFCRDLPDMRISINWSRIAHIVNNPEAFESVCSLRYLWAKKQNFVPRAEIVKVVKRGDIEHFNKKMFMSIMKEVEPNFAKDNNGLLDVNAIQAAYGLMSAFGCNWKKWLRYQVHNRGVSVHDATYWLPSGSGYDLLGHRMHKDWKDADIATLTVVSKIWKRLTLEEQRLPISKIKELQAIKLVDVPSDIPLVDAANYAYYAAIGYDRNDIMLMLSILHNVPNHETIPNVVAISNCGKYKMYRLSKDDNRGLVLGHLTNCCQSIGSAADSCAQHGVLDPNGAFFVIEKQGKIIAQSWTWRNDDVLVFDNVESLSSEYIPVIKELYTKVANQLIGKLSIKECRVGMGHDDSSLNLSECDDIIETPKDAYSDAKYRQCKLA